MARKTEEEGIKLPEGFHFERDVDFLYVIKDGKTIKDSIAIFNTRANPTTIFESLRTDGLDVALVPEKSPT